MLRVSLLLALFWLMQVVAQVLFKWGSLAEPRWWAGFVGGNLFGFSSIWLLMLVYRELNPNVALALATAGSFVFGQLGISYGFRSSMTGLQWLGVGVITAGVVLVALAVDTDH